MKLAAAVGDSKVTMMTVAGEVLDNSKMKKTALSRGPADMLAVKADGAEEMDNLAVAMLLKSAIEKQGDFDLVLCGEGSGDMYSQQLGNVLGGALGWPTLNVVTALRYEDGKLIAERTDGAAYVFYKEGVATDGARTETFAISGKAVISVASDICRPRIPTMKEIMGAGKKPVTIIAAADLEGAPSVTEVGSVLAPVKAQRKLVKFHEAEEEEFAEFINVLKANI